MSATKIDKGTTYILNYYVPKKIYGKVNLLTIITQVYKKNNRQEKKIYMPVSMIVYKKIDELYVDWQQVKTNDNQWYDEWQRVTTSGTTSHNEWQRVTTSHNEWQRVTENDNK